jgi:glycosyltransferase involved in cell wall biosynthesis
MKLLIISTDKKIFEKGSMVARRQIELGKKLEEIHIVVFTPKGFTEAVLSENVWAYATNSSAKIKAPFDAIRLGRFLIERRGITHITCQDPFLTGMAGVSLKKQFGVHLELQLHTDIGSPHFGFTLTNKIRKAMAFRYVHQADHIRVVSEKIKMYLIDQVGISSQKIEVRPIPVDTEKIKNAPVTVDLHQKYPQFQKIVLMASRLEKEKNIALAISAWPEVIKKVPRTGLVIVGEGGRKAELQKLVRKLGVAESVIFEEWADQMTLASYYKTAELFLLTSLYEGYGMVLAEARAAGTRIVSTDVGVAKEMGAVIADWSVDDVAEKIVYSLGTNQPS